MSDRRGESGDRAFRAVVRGGVQGVGFRYSTVDAAARYRVAGWVRNQMDGSVEVFAQGPPEALEAFREWLNEGPRAARVDAVETAAAPVDRSLAGFVIR